MNVAETLTARLIGTVFVERGLLSESQIRVALEIQRETEQQLGQILVERFGVSRQELAGIVAEQWADLGRSAPTDVDADSNESWRRLGEIFVERGFVTPEQLDQALERQRETGERVGEALVAQGTISKFELAGALAEQMSALDEAAVTADRPATEATVVSIAPRLEEPPALVPPMLPTSVTEPEPEPEPEPERQPTFGWVAFVSTTTGYRLVQLSGPVPEIGAEVDVPDVGELVVLRLGRSPLPRDERTCVFLEPPVRAAVALVG